MWLLREFQLKTGHGAADYLLFVDQKAAGVIEAKPEGLHFDGSRNTIREIQHRVCLMKISVPHPPLPFLYESTGIETQFTNLLDPYTA